MASAFSPLPGRELLLLTEFISIRDMFAPVACRVSEIVDHTVTNHLIYVCAQPIVQSSHMQAIWWVSSWSALATM